MKGPSLVWLVILVSDVCVGLEVVILHTNDAHARIEQTTKWSSACSQENADDGECYGGVARRMTQILTERNRHPNVLLLDGGDQFQGTTWFYYYNGLEASHFMNRLGYDAMVSW